MGLESGNFLSDLDQANPVTATDPVSEGSNHLRLIKKVLQATFPNYDEAVTLSPAQINGLSDAALKSAANTFSNVNTFDNGTTFNIGPNLAADGEPSGFEMLRFNQDRAWAFETFGTGAANALHLRSITNNKTFRITGADGSIAVNVAASDAEAGRLLVNDGAGNLNDVAAIHKAQTFSELQTFSGSNAITLSNTSRFLSRNGADDGYVRIVQVGADDISRFLENTGGGAIFQTPAGTFIRFLEGTSDVARVVSREAGSLQVYDRGGVAKKAGFRNPTRRSVSGTVAASQDDEGRILDWSGAGIFDAGVMEANSTMRVVSWGGAVTINSTGTTLRHLVGDGTQKTVETLTLAQGSVGEFYWATDTIIYVFGNGLS